MRKQRAFSALTEQEIEQLADWLRREPCETVLDRVKFASATRAAAPSKSRPSSLAPRPKQQFQVYDWLQTLGHTDTVKKLPTPSLFQSLVGGAVTRLKYLAGRSPRPHLRSLRAFLSNHRLHQKTQSETRDDTKDTKSTRPVHEKPQQIREIHEKKRTLSCSAWSKRRPLLGSGENSSAWAGPSRIYPPGAKATRSVSLANHLTQLLGQLP